MICLLLSTLLIWVCYGVDGKHSTDYRYYLFVSCFTFHSMVTACIARWLEYAASSSSIYSAEFCPVVSVSCLSVYMLSARSTGEAWWQLQHVLLSTLWLCLYVSVSQHGLQVSPNDESLREVLVKATRLYQLQQQCTSSICVANWLHLLSCFRHQKIFMYLLNWAETELTLSWHAVQKTYRSLNTGKAVNRVLVCYLVSHYSIVWTFTFSATFWKVPEVLKSRSLLASCSRLKLRQ